jgi:hypothetical protein
MIFAGLLAKPFVAGGLKVVKSVPWQGWALLAVLISLFFLRWHWIDVGESRCEARHIEAQEKANRLQVQREGKRDKTSEAVSVATEVKVAAAVAKTEESTHARDIQIIRVPVAGECRVPVGLPDLAPAVDAANAANG